MRDAAIDTHRQAARGAAHPRSAGAPSLEGLTGEGPASRGPARKGGASSAAVAAQRLGGGRAAGRGRSSPGLIARLRRHVPRIRPLKALVVGTFSVALVGIVANAMVFQRGRHPSPLFGLGQSVDGLPDAAPRPVAAVPPPASAPADHTGAITPAAAPEPVSVPAAPAAAKVPPLHRAVAKVHEAAKPKAADGKLRAEAPAHPRPGHPAPKVDARPEPKAEAKPDPVAKLLAEPAHPAKGIAKLPGKPLAERTEPEHRVKTEEPRRHHRLAVAEPPAEAGKKTPKPE